MLHVHRSERADGLVAALRDLLADPLPDPFASEVVCVPTRGMERWLSQRLSAGLGARPGLGDGVCANVDFPSPWRLATDVVAAATGIEPESDPWRPERAVWPLLQIVDEGQAELGPLAEHAAGPRRYAAVRHLAGLFDAYALHRPEMLAAWAAGQTVSWQAELWRRLDQAIPEPGPAARMAAACARLQADPAVADLPARLSLFGLTRLPAGRLAVLRALAAYRDVHLFLLHPSPALWERIRGHGAVVRRADDPTTGLPANPLLASWGHDSRELQLVIGDDAQDHRHAVEHGADTLLARMQADVREDRAPLAADDPARPRLAPDDRSVEIHACHGRARQVEVLRDAILHLLAADPTLEPRDVIVMCPDIETFAPLIHATFGAGDEELPGALPDLRVRLADRSIRQTNPVLGVVARLLELVDERLTASQVLDLADREPVRRRFGFDDDDLARAEEWVRASGIRWGLDAPHRKPFKLDGLPSGTWRAGLDRLLLGVTMTEDEQRLFAGVLPLDDVESGAIELAGRVAELLDRLHAAVDALTEPKPVDDWAAAIAAAADALTETSPNDAWQRAELQRLLDDVVSEAAGHASPLVLTEVRALLADRLRGRPTRTNFRTGHLTVCTLVPMRSVPHRVVCLLGLDDGSFPRKSPRDGDDLMLDDPHVGERDARTEDRQLLLDALMAAGERLIVTYTGNDERTNLPRPPAVPVGELLEVVDRTVAAETDRPRDRVVVRHPLQPFDQRNFAPGELVPGRVWSFDRVTLAGARALDGERTQPGPFLTGPLPPLDDPVIELADLVRFAERPVRAFLRQRLGIRVGSFDDEIEDALPVELDGLGRWGVGTRLLEARLAGVEPRTAVLAEIARGTLPPGRLGKPVIDKIHPTVDQIAAHAPVCELTSLDVKVALPDGRTLSGTVPDIVGDTLRTVTYSRVNARHRLTAWVRLLAITAAHPGRAFQSVTVGQAQDRDASVAVARIAPVDAATALDHLTVLVDLYDRGMREPAPLYCLTSAAYAAAARSGGDPVAAARAEWEGSHARPGEAEDADHQLVLGALAFDDLLVPRPRPDEQGPWWDPDEPRRLGRWARRLWDGLLQSEQVTEQ